MSGEAIKPVFGARVERLERARILSKFDLLGWSVKSRFPSFMPSEQVLCSLSSAAAWKLTASKLRIESRDTQARKDGCDWLALKPPSYAGVASCPLNSGNEERVLCSLSGCLAGYLVNRDRERGLRQSSVVGPKTNPRCYKRDNHSGNKGQVNCSLSGPDTRPVKPQGWPHEADCRQYLTQDAPCPNHSGNREQTNRVAGGNRACRPTGEGTEQGQTNLLNKDRRRKAAVLTRPRKQPRVGLVKPSPVRQAVRLLYGRIADRWKQHGYRQRDHILSTNTRYFPPCGGSSVVFKPLSTRDHSLSSMSYSEYLKSEHWQEVKARAYEKRDEHCKNKCKMCFAYGPLELHHRTYKNLGKESLADLAFLCRECHQIIHDYVKIGDGKRNKSHLKASKGWHKYCSRNRLWSLRFKNPEEFKYRAQGFFKGYFSNRKNDRQQILKERAERASTNTPA